MRLQLFLAKAGVASRRRSEQFIKQGAISVNGSPVTEMGVQVDPARDRVTYLGQAVTLDQPHVLIAFNKPAGVLSTMQRGREQGGRTLAEAVQWPGRLFPVGRLDRDTEGLILLTNDGDLALKLSHPRYEHEKEYSVTLATAPTLDQVRRLNQPFMIEGYQTQPAKVVLAQPKTLRVILKEGRKRQIRAMCQLTGLRIVRLIRLRVGPYKLDGLAAGQWRVIDQTKVTPGV